MFCIAVQSTTSRVKVLKVLVWCLGWGVSSSIKCFLLYDERTRLLIMGQGWNQEYLSPAGVGENPLLRPTVLFNIQSIHAWNLKKKRTWKGWKELVMAKGTTSLGFQVSGHLSDQLPLHIVRAVTGAGREAVVQRVAQGAHRICPRFAGETGGGRLIHLAAVLHALPRIGVAVTSAAA